jgi:uncharacterized membrane protein YoaK (UPF0700 family)
MDAPRKDDRRGGSSRGRVLRIMLLYLAVALVAVCGGILTLIYGSLILGVLLIVAGFAVMAMSGVAVRRERASSE